MSHNFSNYSKFIYFLSKLGLSNSLNRAGIYKKRGLNSVEMFKECLISIIVGKSLNKYSNSGKALNNGNGISKSSMYRFLSSTGFSWRSCLLDITSRIIFKTSKLTSSERIKTIAIDDSIINRSRSKDTQLLARIFDHCSHRYLKGFQYLCLIWSDGVSSFPFDFAMMSSAKDKNCIKPLDNKNIDARTAIGKRMIESRKTKPQVVVDLLNKAVKAGIPADYVLFDTWFTSEPLISKIRDLGFHVIGMLKHMKNTSYVYKDGNSYSLKALYEKLTRERIIKSNNMIMGSVIVKTKKNNIPVKVLFVRNKNNADKHICLLSTDLDLTNEQIVQTYTRRWSIEINFFNQKQFLNLESGCRANQFSAIIAHTTMVCVCTTILEYIKRCDKDIRTFGAVFESCKEELQEIHINIALDTLMNTFVDYVRVLEDKKLLKKGCFTEALAIAYNMLSSWYTQQIESVRNFVQSIREELLKGTEIPQKINACFKKTPKPLGLRLGL